MLNTIAVGDRIPAIDVRLMVDGAPTVVSAAEVLGHGQVVLFAVPGAFTTGCSTRHLPGYIARAGELSEKGVDRIACLSVNDVFVMNAWGKASNVGDKVMMLADGNGDYSRALGLELDARGFGMGVRGKRFAIIVRDGVASQVNVEEGGEFKVSAADHVLGQL